MKRREFLGGMAATAGALVAGHAAAESVSAGHETCEPSNPASGYLKRGLGKKIPLNRERAIEVLSELKLDGLVALRPHNVYYLTNTYPTLTAFRAEFPAFGVFSRDEAQPDFLVSSTGNSWETANGDREVPEVITFSFASNWQDYINASAEQRAVEPESGGKIWAGFAVDEDADLTDRERAWKLAQETYNPASAATPAWALVKALKESGLINGRVAVDDMRVAYLLEQIGVDTVKIVDGDNIFRKIRQVKTDYEVELIRYAQQATQGAIMAALARTEPGMVYEEVKRLFFAEAAARGTDGLFLIFGVTQGLLPDGEVKRGRSYLLDCSSAFCMYNADFARTVTVGEPSKVARERFRAQQIGREAAFEVVRPGVRFSEIERTARDAMIKAGMPKDVPFAFLHSVGLQHGDDPHRMDVPFRVREDHVLKENMTVTLDLPYLEIGGVAGHNEDMLRITRNGYEILNDPGSPLVVI